MNSVNQIKGQFFQLGTWLSQNPDRVRLVSVMFSAGLVLAAGFGLITPCGPMPGGSDGLV